MRVPGGFASTFYSGLVWHVWSVLHVYVMICLACENVLTWPHHPCRSLLLLRKYELVHADPVDQHHRGNSCIPGAYGADLLVLRIISVRYGVVSAWMLWLVKALGWFARLDYPLANQSAYTATLRRFAISMQPQLICPVTKKQLEKILQQRLKKLRV